MASYMDYAVKNAEQTGMLMGKAADAFMGVEDEEAAVERDHGTRGSWALAQTVATRSRRQPHYGRPPIEATSHCREESHERCTTQA